MLEPKEMPYAPQRKLLERLKQRAESGEFLEFIFFWMPGDPRKAPDAACLSQWHAADFQVDGLRYPTAEHFMMAEKARCFRDEATLSKILSSTDPKEAKALGRQVKGFEASTWAEISFGAVCRGNEAKFRQNPKLREYLLGTEGTCLVEASPFDRIWGIGLASDDAKARDPRQWRGLNLLGLALERVRGRLHR
jgi:ribA/ribD-fused uncharacterized protein